MKFNVRSGGFACTSDLLFSLMTNTRKNSKIQKHKSWTTLMSTKVFAVLWKLKLASMRGERDLLSHVVLFSQVEIFIIQPNSSITKWTIKNIEQTIKHVQSRQTYTQLAIKSLPSGIWWMIMLEPRKSRNDSFVRLPRTWFDLGLTVPCTWRMGRMFFCIKASSGKFNELFYRARWEKHIKESRTSNRGQMQCN